MSRRLLVGIFDHEDDVLEATRVSRERGLTIVDVYSPYAVHGLDEAMGLRPPSTLPWVCLVLGLAGAGFKVWFEFWASAVDWPINVGGRPWNSLPAFVPLTFEVMVLFAGVSTVIAFFMVTRLHPGREAVVPDPRVTDDRFVLILEETDAAFDVDAVRALFEQRHAVRVEERIEREA
jgi:hypothetical protein